MSDIFPGEPYHQSRRLGAFHALLAQRNWESHEITYDINGRRVSYARYSMGGRRSQRRSC